MASSDVFVTFGGDTGALEAAIGVVKSQMNALTREMRTAAAEFNKTGRAAESELGQKLKAMGAEMAAAKDEMKYLQAGALAGGDAIKQMGEKIGNAAYEYGPWTGMHVQLAQAIGVGLATAARDGSLAMTALGVGVGVAAAATLAAVAVIASQTQGLRDLDDAARAAHVSMTALKNLNTAGGAVGVDAAQMNQEMSGFAAKLREAQVAGGDLADFLKENNVAIKDAHGNLLPVQEVFGKIAALILSSNNEMDRLAALSKAGFSSDMLRLIERQTEAVKTFAASAGSAQDDVMKRGLADGEALSAAWHGAWSAVSEAALSMSVSVLGSIGEIEHQGAAKFDELANRAASAFARIAGDAQAAATAAANAFNAQRAEVYRSEAMAVAGGKSPFGALDVNAFGPQKSAAAPASDAPTIKGLYDKGDKAAKSPKAKSGADDTRKDAQEETRAAVDAARATFEQKKSLLDEYTKLHIISAQDQIAGTKAALNEEYEAQKAALEKEKQLSDLKPSQRRAIDDQILKIEAQHQKEMQKLQFQAVEEEIKDWTHMVDTMSGSLSSGLSGMIEGTKTFGQSMQSLAQSVERQFVKMGLDLVADWVKGELAKTAATSAGASARTGFGAAEAATGAATNIASVLKSITASAAETFAGVFGFLSPVMGPLAAGPAAAAQGAVLAVSPFAVGAWELSKDQLALVHSGEMIMPAAESGAFRSMLSNAAANGSSGGQSAASGGDTHVHLNVSALDSGSVKNWLSGNSRQIMQAMNQAVKNGDHLGLRRLSGA